jgi:tRNA (guanine37-N1)-methyltransferase
MMRVFLVAGLPGVFEGFLDSGIVGIAVKKGLLDVTLVDLRDFTTDSHRSIDDYPYGGGPGMVMKPDPIFKAMKWVREADESAGGRGYLLSPQGAPFTQAQALELADTDGFTLVCGRYKDVDERVRLGLGLEEISIGDYVLSGGEPAACVIVDSVARLLPGAVGDAESARTDSIHSGLLDCPYYTRPEEWEGMGVPEVLLSGHHAAIERWRRKESLRKTALKRPDLLDGLDLEEKDRELLEEIGGEEDIDISRWIKV